MLIGPFGSEMAAQRWVTKQLLGDGKFESTYNVRALHVPEAG